MKKTLKHVICFMLAAMLLLPVCLFTGCGGGDEESQINEFYDAVSESQTKLDIIADDIYSCWYDAIYKNSYSGNINIAIATAISRNSSNLEFVESNEVEIQSLYKKLRDSKYSTEVKEVMSAYSSYYEFVVNVSGSFNSYSSSKESLKKDLAKANIEKFQ